MRRGMSLCFAIVLCIPAVADAAPAEADAEAREYGGPPDVAWPDDAPGKLAVATPNTSPSVDAPTPAPPPTPSKVDEPSNEKKQPSAETPRLLQPLTIADTLVLGGYIQPGFTYVTDTEFNPNDQDGFEFANARLTGKGDRAVYKKLSMGFRFNFDVNQGSFGVRDVYGSIYWREGLIGFDIGQLKQPFSLSLLQYQWGLQFPYSPEVRRLAFGRDQGAQLRSEGVVGKQVWMRAFVMISNGEGGFRQRRNIDNKFQYTGRFEIAPLGKPPLEEPDLNNSRPKFMLAANAGHSPSVGDTFGANETGAKETRVGGDAFLHFKGLSVRVEYVHAFRSAIEMQPEAERYGTAAQAGYVLPIPIPLPRFEIAFRFQQYDVNTRLNGTEGAEYVVDNTAQRIYEPALNIYLFEHNAKLMLSYKLTDLIEGPRVDTNGDPLIGDAFLAFFQFAWL